MNTSPRAISDGSNAWRSHGCPRHLVYLLKQSPNERDAERFGINAALARGFQITILDLQALILPDVCALHSDWEPGTLSLFLVILKSLGIYEGLLLTK